MAGSEHTWSDVASGGLGLDANDTAALTGVELGHRLLGQDLPPLSSLSFTSTGTNQRRRKVEIVVPKGPRSGATTSEQREIDRIVSTYPELFR